MALAIVQGLLRILETDASVTRSWTSTPTQGNLLIAIGRGTTVITNASISGWTLAKSILSGTTTSIGIWYKIAGASEGDVTLDWVSSTATYLQILEVSGLASAVLDKTAGTANTGGVTSKSTGTTATTTANEEFCIAAVSMGDVVSSLSWSNSFNNLDTLQTLHFVSYLFQSAAAAQETTASWTTSRIAGACIATFKAGAAAGIAIPVLLNQFRMRRE